MTGNSSYATKKFKQSYNIGQTYGITYYRLSSNMTYCNGRYITPELLILTSNL